MLIKSKIIFVMIILLSFQNCQTSVQAESEIFIHFNQLGFLPNDVKTAIVLSYQKLDGKQIFIFNSKNRQKAFTGYLTNNRGQYGSFPFTYIIDFSTLKETGEYFFQFDQQRSFTFRMGENIFNGLADSLLQFFKIQRCGYTDPFMHRVCHISDATSIIDGNKVNDRRVDVTGGWHDAGDYIKSLNTTAYATYMLLFSYEFDPIKFGFDNNKNGAPDILEEAKIGLDWMLRAYIDKNKFITLVQDMRDHDVGWRMPEDDPLGFDRPAFVGMGKNLIGIYSATMALAYRIWRDKFQYPEFANQCLTAAQDVYSIRNIAADVDSSGTGVYLDKSFEGKMALGAVELFISTNKQSFLNDAVTYADSADSDYWWSWGDINSLAHYRLAKFIPRFAVYISKNLEEFNKKKNDNLFGNGVSLSWGTNVTLLGVTLQNILYKKLTNDSKYDSVSVFSRDFILGRNAWGISFVYGFGKNYSKNFHHQISFLKGKLPGGFAAGPASKELVEKSKIPYDKPDHYAKFQTKESYYRDDRQDYITNEPTITGNATAMFVFGNLSGRK